MDTIRLNSLLLYKWRIFPHLKSLYFPMFSLSFIPYQPLLTYLLILTTACHSPSVSSQTSVRKPSSTVNQKPVLALQTGAEQFKEYIADLKGKRVALVVNHTSLVGKTHLADTLLSQKINIVKIFAPEHGFRGDADAGEHVSNTIDKKTGLPLISIYGKNKKPSPEQLKDVDVVIFDIQDVGARFYTYISTMHYVMEACAENQKKCLVLDRPNPNGHYFDGPVLKPAFKSFIGMHQIPVVHGLTVGELAQMINGEGWLANNVKCDLKVIQVKGYTHQTPYVLPVRPSPGLPTEVSIRLYPSICFFEGTTISLGRGTDFSFQVAGAPNPIYGSFTFTPKTTAIVKNPPHENQLCYGKDYRQDTTRHLTLKYLLDFYNMTPDKSKFFLTTKHFDLLAGSEELKKQILAGMTEEQIRATWQSDLQKYATMRKKYLLYPDK
ncbi:DUF1343 domain-containing protein [Cytophagaceae bacterium NT2B1]|nr:DUF1343 domain-containing protein [Xanthocytophaga flavus]MDJ1468513.1 DUF1343 domain-containing protein [Xanthocytophaga flavus]